MDDFVEVRASDVGPDELQQLLADRIAREQMGQFRRFIVTRFAIVMAGAWLLSWPIHLLPHTVLWALVATGSFVIVLISPPRTHGASPGRQSKPPR